MISTLRTASGRAPLARISNSIGARGRGIVPANGNLDSIRRNVAPFSSMSYLIAEHETGRFREAAARPFVLAANAIDMGFSGIIIDSSESPSDSPQSVQTVAFRDLQGCGAVDDDGG